MRLNAFITTLNKIHPDTPIRFHCPICTRKIPGYSEQYVNSVGIGDLYSYRGYYDNLSIEPSMIPTTVREVSEKARDALGSYFPGYKGGLYKMTLGTPLWCSYYDTASNLYIDSIEIVNGEAVIYTREQLMDYDNGNTGSIYPEDLESDASRRNLFQDRKFVAGRVHHADGGNLPPTDLFTPDDVSGERIFYRLTATLPDGGTPTVPVDSDVWTSGDIDEITAAAIAAGWFATLAQARDSFPAGQQTWTMNADYDWVGDTAEGYYHWGNPTTGNIQYSIDFGETWLFTQPE